MNVLIIGGGRVGSALARSLRSSRQHRVATSGHDIRPSRVRAADVIVLAVPDDAIQTVSTKIAPSLMPGACVLHCAGARGTEELDACSARGASVGIMHPLVSFPSKRSHPSLEGTTFTVHGARKAIAASRQIASACGARAVVASTGDPSYHAAAALAANGAVALAFESVHVLTRLGFEQRDAERAIGGLLRTVGNNVERLGVPEALTGPIFRGEADTVALHRTALRDVDEGARRAYDAVLPVVVRCARAAGLSKKSAEKILRLLAR